MRALPIFVSWALTLPLAWAAPGPFFDPTVPVSATPVDAGSGDIVARGLLLRLGRDQWLVFDQDLLRPVRWFHAPADQPPVSLDLMAQASWEKPTQKGGVVQPRPAETGTALALALPGVGQDFDELSKDPRPVFGADAGRGGLEAAGRRFLGYRFAGDTGVLQYRCHRNEVQEWYEAEDTVLRRHLVVTAGGEVMFRVAGGDFRSVSPQQAVTASLAIASNHAGLTLEVRGRQVIARLAASSHERRVSLTYDRSGAAASASSLALATPAVPVAVATPRWQGTIETPIAMAQRAGPGWELDRIGLPVANPWQRRIRSADLVFLDPEQAAVVTFEGDVWRISWDGESGRVVRWRRCAAGLCEPLSIEQVGGVLQVFTRNGIVRLRDVNGDGETDFYENHSSLPFQTAGTRGYPLDMEVDETGRSWCSIGGIVTGKKSLTNEAPANPHSGAILEISPDGEKLQVLASRAREPFFARDPASGRIAMADQQGNYIPSSGCFPVAPGGDFGFGDPAPRALSLPAVWIPHEQDTSSASPLWLRGTAFKNWEGGLLDLSYGTGRLFLVRPGEGWPATGGAVIPLGIDTGLPVLHGRTHPRDGSLWLAGFRIYDSRAPELEGIGRLRSVSGTLAAPVDAWAVSEGVVLRFDGELDPASVKPEAVQAREWQYRRSPDYGSPRLRRDGSQGIDPVATAGVVLSQDGRSAFIHIPDLRPTMQLEVTHRFRLKAGNTTSQEPVYFTVSALRPADWRKLGFEAPPEDATLAAIREVDSGSGTGVPTAGWGKDLAGRYGCIACHSIDGAKEGHSGPTWKGLADSERRFTDGGSAPADDAYLRESILDPARRIVDGYALGMGSYAGVLNDPEIASLLLYIRSLK